MIWGMDRCCAYATQSQRRNCAVVTAAERMFYCFNTNIWNCAYQNLNVAYAGGEYGSEPWRRGQGGQKRRDQVAQGRQYGLQEQSVPETRHKAPIAPNPYLQVQEQPIRGSWLGLDVKPVTRSQV